MKHFHCDVRIAAALLLALAGSVQAVTFDQAGVDQIRAEKLARIKDNGIKQVVVPYFRVNVHTKLNKTARASSGLFGGGKAQAKSAMFTQWDSPDLAMLQQVTDQALQGFEQQLTAAGLSLVPMSKVTATEAFKKINGGPEPVKTDDMVSLAPTGMKVYDPGAKIDPNGGFMLGMANLNQKLEPDIAREVVGSLDGVAVMRVTLNLAYGDFDIETSASSAIGSSGSDTASAKVGFVPVLVLKQATPTVTPEITGVEIHSNFDSFKLPNGTETATPKDYTRLQLKEALSGEVRVSQLQDVTTTGEKAGAASVALFGLLMGKGASLEVGNYKAAVDATAFVAESKKGVDKFAALIGQMLKAQP